MNYAELTNEQLREVIQLANNELAKRESYIPKLLVRLSEKREATLAKPALLGIIERAVSKFFDEAEERVIDFELKDYIISQFNWKKQNHYYDLMPVLFIAFERLNADFEMLFTNQNPTCWRDAYDIIIY